MNIRSITTAVMLTVFSPSLLGSPLTIASDISVAGNITLTAIDTGSPGDNLTYSSGVSVTSTGGSVTNNAGDNFTLPSTASINAFGNIFIEIDFGDADPGIGATATVEGALDALMATITGGPDSDTFIITPDDTTPINVSGGAGTDALHYSGFGGVVTFLTASSGIISAPNVTDVNFINIETITGASVVPVPAAVWLFGTGLIGLIGLARGNKTSHKRVR